MVRAFKVLYSHRDFNFNMLDFLIKFVSNQIHLFSQIVHKININVDYNYIQLKEII